MSTRSSRRTTSIAALASGLTLLSTLAQAASVVNITFSEVPLGTTDPTISGLAFSAGAPAAFEDTIVDDGASPANPYLLSGVEGSGAVDLPAFNNTAFIGVSLAT